MAPWQVGKWKRGEYADNPWFACDRGGWFGKGLPGRSFATQQQAFDYAFTMATLLGAGR